MSYNSIAIEGLTLIFFFKILFFFKKKKIYIILENNNFITNIYLNIFKKFRINFFLIENFYAGDIKKNNQTIFNLANNYTTKSINLVLNRIFKKMTDKNILKVIDYKEEEVRYFVAKLIYNDLHLIYIKYFLFKSLVKNNCTIFFRRTKYLNQDLLLNVNNLNKIIFPKFIFFYGIGYFFVYFIEFLWAIFYNLSQIRIKNNFVNKKILTFQSQSVSSDKSLRTQPYWFDTNYAKKRKINIFIIKKNNLFIKNNPPIIENVNNLKKKNIFILPSTIIYKYSFFLKNFLFFNNYLKIFKEYNSQISLIYVQIINFLNYKINLKNFIESEKFSLIVLEENFPPSTEAVTSVATELNINSLSIQYSNLGNISVPMIANCDYQMIFSKNFKKLYSFNYLKPKNFFECGSIYINNNKNLLRKSNKIKKYFKKIGVKFIICYFDERIDYSKYGNNSFNENLKELKSLFKFVLADKSLGLIMKSQFMKYSPSRVYTGDDTIEEIKNSKRYIELEEGLLGIGRNIILPIEAFYNADLTISQKYGATAGLEAAMISKRTILINRHRYKTIHDNIYKKCNICFNNIEDAITQIKKYRVKKNNLGDWNNIKRYFSKYHDFRNRDRVMRQVVKIIKKT